MVFDAHDKAFAFFGGTCTRGIYDSEPCAPLMEWMAPAPGIALCHIGCCQNQP